MPSHCAAVCAGSLNVPVTLEEPSDVIVSGDATVVWTNKGADWISMLALTGFEGQLTAEGTYRCKMRYRSDMTSRWRLGMTGTTRKFQITGPPMDADGRRRELVFNVSEIKA